MSLSGAWSRFLRHPASPPDPSRAGGALWRGVAGALGGICRPGRAAVLALACLALLSGAATQAHAQSKPTVSFEPIAGLPGANARTQWVKEDSGTHNLKVTLNPAPTSPLTVTYKVSGNANSGSDYTPLSGTLSVPAGATTATIPVTIIDDNVDESSEEIAVWLNDPVVGSAAYRLGRPSSYHLIIDPSDGPPWVSFARESRSADEGSGTHNVGVRLHPAPTSPLTVTYQVTGTATSGSDYTALSGTVTVPKDATTATIPVTIVDDSLQEGSETVVLKLTEIYGYRVESPGTHTLTIAASDKPAVSVTAGPSPVTEGTGATFTVGVSPAPSENLLVNLTVADAPGADFVDPGNEGGDTVTILAGRTSATYTVDTVPDSTTEPSGAVTVTVTSGTGYEVGSPASASVQVTDDDATKLYRDFISLEEDKQMARLGKKFHFDVTRLAYTWDGVFSVPDAWGFRLCFGGTATPGVDYHVKKNSSAGGGRVQLTNGCTRANNAADGTRVPAGQAMHSFVVVPYDVAKRMGKTIVVTVDRPINTSLPRSRSKTTLTYTLSSPPRGLSFAATLQYVIEGHGTYRNVEVYLSPAPSTDITLAYTVGGTATPGSDFTIANSGTLSVPAGAKTAYIPVKPIDDSLQEARETVVLKLIGNKDYPVASPGTHTLTIVDDEKSTISFASASRSAGEGSGTHDVEVRLDLAPASDMELGYTVEGTATSGSDYKALAGLVPVAKGATTATIPVTLIDDSLQEGSETVVLKLVWGSGYLTGSPDTHTLTITDNDPVPKSQLQPGTLPEVTIAAGASPVTEGSDATFTVTANPAPAANLAVTVAVAVDGDYGIAAGEQTVTIPTTGSATLTLTTTGDEADETDGSVTVTVKDGEGYTVGDPASGTVAVQDDDEPAPAEPAVSLSAGSSPVTEGGDAVFTLTASPAPASPLAATVAVAVDGDYGIAAGEQTVTIPTTGSATLTLTTVNDEADETDGSVTVTVKDGEGYSVGFSASGTVAIADDDPAPAAVATVDPALVALVRGYAAETWKHPDHVKRWMRVLAAFGDDNGYTAMTAAEAQVFADQGWQRWVPVVAALEALEAAPLTLPAVTVSAGADVTEGGDAVFTVTANPAPAAALSVTVTVATAGEFGVTAGTQTVPIPTTGSATLTLATATANDEVDEPDGSVSVTVAAGDGYTVGDPASGTVAIADDDAPPAVATVDPALVAQVRGYAAETHQGQAHVDRWKRVLAAFGDDNGYTPMTAAEAQTHADKGWQRWVPVAAALAALEAPPETLPAVTVSAGADVTEGGDATFTVTANPAPAAELSVTVTVTTAGEFGVTAGTQTVPIPTTGSATLTLATSNDEADEPDGSVSVTVAAGDGYTVGDPASGTVAIADDDAPLPAIAVSAGDAVTEGGDATFTVTASPAPASPLAVSVTVATEGDYGIASGTRTVSIPAAGSATLTLATSDDAADEPDGSVTLTVAAGDGYTVGAPATGSVSIADDDLPPPAVSIAAKAASVTEGGAAAFTITADRAPDADLTVTLSVAETGGGDHVAAADEGPATAVIAKGKTEAVFSVATVDDDVDEPDGSVTVTLKDGGGYTVSPSPGDAAAVTVSDNDAAALPSLSVADVTVTEGAWMEFTVRLSAPSAGGVSVKVSTRDSTPVSATTRDYWPISGRTVSFRAGETERSVGVIVFDDSHDEEAETFEVVLSDARGAAIGDGVAVGTITNDDPMPAAWLARFGRTVAEQALDGIAGRMSADRTPGMHGSIAGQALSFDPAASDNPGSRGAGPGHAPDGAAVPGGTGALALADVAQALGGQSGPGGFGHDAAGFGGTASPQSQTMTARDALLGSSFSLTGAADGSGGSMAFWGRAAQGSFDGREGTFSLDGTVTTGMLGADYARGKWLVGLALAQSAGEGDYRDSDVAPRPDGQSCPDGVDSGLCSGAVRAGDGKVEASLTAAIPYAALQASERLKLWGAAGYGSGEVTLKTALGGSYKADTTWSMAAAGLRGDLLAPPAEGSGPALAVTSDALWTRTSSEKTNQLAASESDATRLRLGLEGSYRMALEGGGHLTPKLEVGARHDGGDAETGFGVEIGGGVVWTDPKLGLSLDVSGRTLIAHGNDDLKDRGYAASLAFDPDPATGRGPSLSLRQEFGGQAQGGLDALFQPATLEDRTGSEATSRWAMEAAYGFPVFGGRWTGSPHAGLGLATAARDYSLGWRLTPEAANAPDVSFGLRATRRESDTAQAEHTVGFEVNARW